MRWSLVCLLIAAPAAALAAPVVGSVVLAPGDGSPATAARAIEQRFADRGLATPLATPARRALLDDALPPPAEVELLATAAAAMDEARAAAGRFDEVHAAEARARAAIALERALPSPTAAARLAEVHLAEGVAHAIAGDAAGARTSFGLVRALAPELTKLDPAAYRPDVVTQFARAGSAAGKPVRLAITADPAGATIAIDARPAGVAPIEQVLAPGVHYVSATHAGHETRTERVELTSGATLTRALVLARTPAEADARDLRRALADPGAQTAPLAASLAALASVDLLVLTRPGASGPEAALYDTRARRLSAWGPPGAVMPLFVAEAPTPTPTRNPAMPEPERPGRPWYRSTWGMTAIVGTVVVVAAVTAFALADGGTTSYCVAPAGGTCAD